LGLQGCKQEKKRTKKKDKALWQFMMLLFHEQLRGE
jgi:hypothetical protein